MGLIRQYLKQKVARGFGGKKVDLDQLKKEIKDEITHVLYDQTRRTPIVIPVINEIGGGGQGRSQERSGDRSQGGRSQDRSQNRSAERPAEQPIAELPALEPKNFPPRQEPDTEANQPKQRTDTRGY